MEFNEIQFTPANNSPTAQIAVMHEGRSIGQLAWRPGNGSVDRLWVHPEHRRQGIAIGMMRHVQENYMPTMANGKQMRLQHSSHRDPDGEAFAQATKHEFYAPPNLDAPRRRNAGRNRNGL